MIFIGLFYVLACNPAVDTHGNSAHHDTTASTVVSYADSANLNIIDTTNTIASPLRTIDEIKRVLAIDPNCSPCWIKLGKIYTELGKIELAISSYKNTLIHEPNQLQAVTGLVQIYIGASKFQDAMDLANEVLRADVYEPQGYYLKGLIYKYVPDTALAISSFQTALEQNEEHYEALVQLATLTSLGQPKLAEQYYNRLISLDSTDVNVWHNYGWFQQINGRHDNAIASYDKALMLDSNKSVALYARGVLALEFEADTNKAIQLFNSVLAIDPSHEFAKMATTEIGGN